MATASHRFAWYMAVLQLLFTLAWTVYAVYLPKLAAAAGISAGAVILILMMDQAIFTVCDFFTGIATDRVARVLGRVGVLVAAVTALSCAAFIALPFTAAAGAPLLIGLIVVWTVTSSALRAPPWMLLGKYAAKPQIPLLASLAMLGYGVAGAVSPYLAVTLRDLDPRAPFALTSVVLVLTTLGMITAERKLAPSAGAAREAPPRAFGTFSRPAAMFTLAMIVLALGYQIHFALESAALFRRFASPADLKWLMPVFWIGFNLALVPAGMVVKRYGGHLVMGIAALVGALAIAGAHAAQGLGLVVAAQLIAGAAWGAILTGAFTVAFAVGANGGEGRMSGILFSTLAVATLARTAVVASGINSEPALKAALQWMPVVCWTAAGAALVYLAVAGVQRLTKSDTSRRPLRP